MHCTFSPAKPHGRPKGRRSVKSKGSSGNASTGSNIPPDLPGPSSFIPTFLNSSPVQGSYIEQPVCSTSAVDESPTTSQNELNITGHESGLPLSDPWFLPLTPGVSVDVDDWMSYRDCNAMLDIPNNMTEDFLDAITDHYHVSSTLLLFSCYAKMESLYDLLMRRLMKLCKDHQALSSFNNNVPVPAFRIGHSRLSMPPTASLGMHVIAINSMM